jgi:transposase
MRQTEFRLSRQERQALQDFRSKGERMARELNRAHILAALDRKIPERQIMEVLGVGRTAVWRTRAAYLQGGLEYALCDVQRPGQPKRYRGPEEAEVSALACSSPPDGAKRWTIALLTQRARRHPNMRQISRESIRRLLKKTASNRGAG